MADGLQGGLEPGARLFEALLEILDAPLGAGTVAALIVAHSDGVVVCWS